MHDIDYEQFVEELSLLSERLPKKLTSKLVESYFNTLKKFHISEVLFILEHWPKHPAHKRFPLESELLMALKAVSTQEMEVKSQITDEKRKKLRELEDRYTHICKNICANSNFDIMKSSKFANLANDDNLISKFTFMDYSAYKTSYTTDELYAKLEQIRNEISEILMGA